MQNSYTLSTFKADFGFLVSFLQEVTQVTLQWH